LPTEIIVCVQKLCLDKEHRETQLILYHFLPFGGWLVLRQP